MKPIYFLLVVGLAMGIAGESDAWEEEDGNEELVRTARGTVPGAFFSSIIN